MKDSPRVGRVADEVRRVLAEALQRDVADERLREVTVTDVVVTRDLGIATVYWLPLLEGDAADARARRRFERSLERAGGFLRSLLASRLGMRHTPELRFSFDDRLEEARRMEALLDDLPATGEGDGEAAGDHHE